MVPTKKYILRNEHEFNNTNPNKLSVNRNKSRKKRSKYAKVNNGYASSSNQSINLVTQDKQFPKNANTSNLERIMSNLTIKSESFSQSSIQIDENQKNQNIFSNKVDKNLKLKKIFSFDYLKKLNQDLSNDFKMLLKCKQIYLNMNLFLCEI